MLIPLIALALLAPAVYNDPCSQPPVVFLAEYDDTDRDGLVDSWLIVARVCGMVVAAEGLSDPWFPEVDPNWSTMMSWLACQSSPFDLADVPDDAPGLTPFETCMKGAIDTCGKGCVLSVTVGVDSCSFTCDTKSPCGPGTGPVKPVPVD